MTFSQNTIDLHYYRTPDKKEIDFVLEQNGKSVAVEVKFAKKISKTDFKHIIDFQKSSQTFHLGVIIYMGEHTLKVGEDLWAVPFGAIFGS